jgi:hypothetical protein
VLATDTLSAQQILDRSAAVYRGLLSYEDEGTVVTTIDSNRVPLKSLAFQTRFTRAGQLRFAYHDTASSGMKTRYAVSIENGRAMVRSSLSGEDGSKKDAATAVAEVTGISDSAAYTIPAALMPAVAWKRQTWLSIPNARRVDDGIERGVRCYRVQHRSRLDSPSQSMGSETSEFVVTTYWVAIDSALLLRVDQEGETGGHRFTAMTQYIPKANPTIEARAFGLDWY